MRYRPYRPEILPNEISPLIQVLSVALESNALAKAESQAASNLLNKLQKEKQKEMIDNFFKEQQD